MCENHNDLNDEICMAFLKQSDLAIKEGDENRVYNSIVLDKSDLAIEAIDFTIQYIMDKQN